MRGIDPRVARAAWTVFLVGLSIFIVYLISRTILIFVFALFFAYMISPVVDVVKQYFPTRISRVWALTIVYVSLLAVLGVAGFFVGTRIVQEATNFGKQLPEYLKDDSRLYQLPSWAEPIREQLREAIEPYLQGSAEKILPLIRGVGEGILAVLGNIGFVLLVPILAFLFLKDGHRLRESALSMFEEGEKRALVEGALADIHVLLGQYIRALVILALATFAVYGLYFSLTGVPYAVLLAGIAAPLEFIPVLGPLAATIIILLVAGIAGYDHLLWIPVFLGLYRLFQDYVLQPYLMGSGVKLHPLVVIFGALAGEQLAGIPGMFLSVPVIATLRVLFVRLQRSRSSHRHTPVEVP